MFVLNVLTQDLFSVLPDFTRLSERSSSKHTHGTEK